MMMMSRSLLQPIGQKRLTNVAVVRLKKHGMRFEIACYKNKALSWRSEVQDLSYLSFSPLHENPFSTSDTLLYIRGEKDLDEVLQSCTVYSNVSKGVLAKSKDLIAAFGTDDHSQICLEILKKRELQVAGKERESQLSSQFRDIATIVMQKTINPETQRPYTISLIERLMHEIHFAVDPHSSSKKQALEVIHELQKHFPIKRSPMKLRLTASENHFSVMEKLNSWNANIISKDESGNRPCVVCEIEPGYFRDCDALLRNLQGKLEVLSISVHVEGDAHADHYDDHYEIPHSHPKETVDTVLQLSEKMQKQTISAGNGNAGGEVKQNKCSTCNAVVGDAKQYRDHFKSDWHKHNLRPKTRQLPPLTAKECMAVMEVGDLKADLKDYSYREWSAGF